MYFHPGSLTGALAMNPNILLVTNYFSTVCYQLRIATLSICLLRCGPAKIVLHTYVHTYLPTDTFEVALLPCIGAY